MRRITSTLAVVAITLGGALALPRAAHAHALLQSSDPAAGSTVGVAPPVVTLVFGESPDPGLSSVKVLDTSGRDVASGPVSSVVGQPDQLQVPLGSLPDGVYTVAWRTVSTVDGHTTAGSFAFGVGVAPSSAAGGGASVEPTSPNGSVGDTLARFLMYLGMLGVLGAGFVGAVVHTRPPRVLAWLAVACWVLLGAGTLAVIGFQIVDAGTDLGSMLTSSLGVGVAGRVVATTGIGLMVGLAVIRRGPANRLLFATLVAGAAAAMFVDVINGHAAAGDLPLVEIGVQWLHALAAGLWMGGLAALLLSLGGAPDDAKARAVRRFSRWAGVSLAIMAITGVLRALSEVGTVEGLIGSDFGRLVIAKSIGLGLLALLGAFNHFVSVPAAVRTLAPLRLVGRVEVTVGAIVVLATGLLVNLAPPTSAATAPPPPAPLTVSGHDFGTTVRVRLTVSPGAAGLNQFDASVTDFDSGEPESATGLTLRFVPASATGVGGSTLRLSSDASGHFSAQGGNLSLDGIWNVTAVVASPSGAVEVPLPLATLVVGQSVDSNAIPDAPTIFTAHLAGGNSLQVYLDPGVQGANELHATFFDTAGSELPVQVATMLVIPTDGSGAIMNPRQLEPGHFVLDLDVNAAALAADVVGAAPDGTLLHGHFDLPVQP